ncbi:MAG: DUF6516 family protein, partial [Thermodesulfovibrionales bacterium]
MPIKDYLGRLLDLISENPFVESQSISFDERPPDAAYLNGKIVFIGGNQLHFKEFIIFRSEKVLCVKYAYNYLSQDCSLIFRYDNALDPKAKSLPTYPNHKHLPEGIVPALKPSFAEV